MSSLRLKLDRLEKENRRLHGEAKQQGRRIYHLRIEIGELTRQVKEMKEDDRSRETLRKQIKGLERTLGSERYIHRQELERIEQALCPQEQDDDEDCGCCGSVRAALPSGGPYKADNSGGDGR